MRRAEGGQSLVEFALMLPVLLLLLVGIFDIGRAVFLSGTINEAVREGTRYAIVHGSLSAAPSGPGSTTFTAPDQDTAVTAAVLKHATGLSGVAVQSTWPDLDAKRGSRVVVSATSPYVPALSAVFTGGGLRITLRSSSAMVIQQ
jgi:Flp pilus assembly protein TadG